MTQTARHQLSAEMEQCIRLCEECHHTCLETITYCLGQGGRHAEAGHIGLLLDCATICHTSADFMLRSSPLHGRICAVCAEVCGHCAQDCDQFGDDAQMKACADACRRCADSCRRMATMAA